MVILGYQGFTYAYEILDFFPPDIVSVRTLLLAIICYVYGSIPFALLFTYLLKRENLSKKGTGNIGVANAFGVGGLRAGFLTVAGELSKAALPLALAHYYYGGEITVSVILVLLVILGANFSIFLKGRGGTGGTILFAALIGLSAYTFLIFAGVFAISFLITRNPHYTTIIGHSLLPLELFLIEGDIPLVIFGLCTAILYSLRYNPRRSDYATHVKGRSWRDVVMGRKYIFDMAKARRSSQVGLKASKLGYLKRSGFKIPKTYVCTFAACDEYVCGNTGVLAKLRAELEEVIDENRSYSIRSSANLEDERDYSFAGQFDSYLDISSLDQVINSILNIWNSSSGDRVAAYTNRIGRSTHDLRMAVIIQEMIYPKLSGVVFTKNPVNGMDEVIVESVSGLGVSLVQAGVTPDRWVYKWGSWIEIPEGKEIDPVISQLALQAKSIARKYGKPVDLEWTYDGKEIYWLQLREITTLKGINIYSNRISKEFMPGIIKPLVWSVNIPVVNTSWKRLFIELVGKAAEDIDINKLAKSFYYRSYFNMGVIGDIFELLGMPRESIELLTGMEVVGNERPKLKPGLKTLKYIPKMLLFAVSKSLYRRKIEDFLVTQKKIYYYYASANIEKLSEKETLDYIDQLFQADTEASYFVIISRLLMGFHNMLLKKQLARVGIDIQDVSFIKERELLRDIDPSYYLARLHDIYDELSEEARLQLQGISYRELPKSSELEDFRSNAAEFLSRFGHLSESGNDFSRAPWKETPDLLLKMIANYQRPEIERRDTIEAGALSRGLFRTILLRYIYDKAVKYRVYNERVSFLYSYGYGLFRPYFLHLAKLFRKRGYIMEEEDIFYLTFDEIRDTVKLEVMTEEYRANLIRRKQEIVQYKEIDLPSLIIGDVPPPPLVKEQVANQLKGLVTSKGYCEGRIKVIRGVKDFTKAEEGDILVIPYSDISWTPLLSKAKAIISESGGMLSHCSIVAREYNVPAIVSVTDACKLRDGTRVAVDGYSGKVSILERCN